MNTFVYFNSITQAMLQIFFLGLIGFVLVRRKIISGEGVTGLTNFLIEATFPALIFWQIITKFSFRQYPNWWFFSLLSVAVTALGLLFGYLFGAPVKNPQTKREFISLSCFQNSGYLPLAVLGWIVPKEQLSTALIYLFLLLLGFNLVFWSWGAYFLSSHKLKKFSLPSLFSPPVIATLLGFFFVFFKLNSLMPKFILLPLEMLGNCSFPLAIIVVGASLADLYVSKPLDKKLILKLLTVKLVLLPAIGIIFVALVNVPYLIGLLIVLELAVPSATSLAVVVRKYAKEENIISQGIFISHVVSLVTLPLFLSLFNWVVFNR